MFYLIITSKRISKGGRWKWHNKYIGQDCWTSFLSMQQIYRCQLPVVAWYACHKGITVRLHLYACCILRKKVHQSCPLYLIWYFQPPHFEKMFTPHHVSHVSCRVAESKEPRNPPPLPRLTVPSHICSFCNSGQDLEKKNFYVNSEIVEKQIWQKNTRKLRQILSCDKRRKSFFFFLLTGAS